MPTDNPAVVHFTASARETAGRAAVALGADLHGPEDMDGVAPHLRALFAAGRPIVGVCAAGVLIRALAPMLADKWSEPPVIAVSEDGAHAAPLLGGHRGANRLALKLADALGGAAALTTAGEIAFGVALDDPPEGWALENPKDAKSAMAALLAGARASLSGEADWLASLGATPVATPGPDRAVRLTVEGAAPLVYWRRTRSLGVGCARFCAPEELIALVEDTLGESGGSLLEIGRLHSLDLKADEAAVHALGRQVGVSPRFYDAGRLEAETPRLANPSETVYAEVGCHGVAEAAALAGAGEGAALTIAKRKSANATCAAAEIVSPPAPARARGRLSVVGIGPGRADLRTPEASAFIGAAEELVGYGLYIDLLGPAANGKARRDYPLGGEEARCRYALERAGEGRDVALICSGDAGIYAMAALVMELLDRPANAGGVSDAARRVEVVSAAGVSALQAASARAGALLGHDFCAISLSDLLTPRETVMARVKAAAEGDFVIAFYNPVSARRRTLLEMARETLLNHRPPDTPVLLASELGRPNETLRRRTLATLNTDEVDMLTTVIVGARASRAFKTGDRDAGAEGWRMYTPRGYASKLDLKDAS